MFGSVLLFSLAFCSNSYETVRYLEEKTYLIISDDEYDAYQLEELKREYFKNPSITIKIPENHTQLNNSNEKEIEENSSSISDLNENDKQQNDSDKNFSVLNALNTGEKSIETEEEKLSLEQCIDKLEALRADFRILNDELKKTICLITKIKEDQNQSVFKPSYMNDQIKIKNANKVDNGEFFTRSEEEISENQFSDDDFKTQDKQDLSVNNGNKNASHSDPLQNSEDNANDLNPNPMINTLLSHLLNPLISNKDEKEKVGDEIANEKNSALQMNHQNVVIAEGRNACNIIFNVNHKNEYYLTENSKIENDKELYNIINDTAATFSDNYIKGLKK